MIRSTIRMRAFFNSGAAFDTLYDHNLHQSQ